MIEKVTVKTERGHISVSYNFKHSYSEELQRRALARARKAVREDFPDSEAWTKDFNRLTGMYLTVLLLANAEWFTDGADVDAEADRVARVLSILKVEGVERVKKKSGLLF